MLIRLGLTLRNAIMFALVNAAYLSTELECSLTERLLPPVLCRTLGLCCTLSWVRGDTGECWWLYEWEGLTLLLLPPELCSVPRKNEYNHLKTTILLKLYVYIPHTPYALSVAGISLYFEVVGKM